MTSQARQPQGVPTGGQFAASARSESDVHLDPAGPAGPPSLPEPTPDQSYCDVGLHQMCSGYTEDENDPETCFCECHDQHYA